MLLNARDIEKFPKRIRGEEVKKGIMYWWANCVSDAVVDMDGRKDGAKTEAEREEQVFFLF